MPAKKAPAKRKGAKKAKKAKKKTSKKAPATRSSVRSADELDKRLDAVHAEAARPEGLTPDHEGLDPTAAAMVREGADDEEAAEWDHAPATTLAQAAQAAMRFVDDKAPFLKLYPTLVVGAGPRGTVLKPWTAGELAPEGSVVDGKKLVRMLKAAGPDAAIHSTPEKVIVKGEGRFALQRLVVDVPVPAIPPTTGEGAGDWSHFDPVLFQAAAACAGDDKIEPPMFAGVNVGTGVVSATDRQSFFYAQTGWVSPWAGEHGITLPRDTFAGLEGQVWVCLDLHGNVFVASPCGEYRMVVPYGDVWPDVQAVIDAHASAFKVAVGRADLIAALRRMQIVQKRTSSVMLHVFPDDGGVYQLEMRAQDPHGMAEYVERLALQDYQLAPNGAPEDREGRFKTFTSGENLKRLAHLSPDPHRVELAFGADGRRDPVGLEAPSYRVLICAMSA